MSVKVDYMTVPDENKEWKYVVQAHVRGASVHLDLRLQVTKTILIGWTIDLIKSILAELILKYSNEEEFKKALKKDILKDKNWREYLKQVIEDPTMKMKDELSKALDDKYKERIRQYTLNMSFEEMKAIVKPYAEKIRQFFSDPNAKALSQTKAPEPYEWLTVEGRVEPGEVGATRNLPGFFVILDKGTVEFLAQKEYFHEYYFHGDMLNGKFVWRRIARTKKWQKAGRERQVWMVWRTKDDDLPYVLKPRAVQDGWMPPEGHSALPKHIREQIPDAYQYWKYKGAKARKIRDELVQLIRKKELKLKTIREVLETVHKFQLKRLWWRGQIVVRGMPRVFYILLIHNKKIHSGWHFTRNPIRTLGFETVETVQEYLEQEDKLLECPCILEQVMQVVQIPLTDLSSDLLKDKGTLSPEHPLNPNEEIPLYFDTIDKGTVRVIAEDKDAFYRLELKGKHLKGIFALQRTSPSSPMWKFRYSELPQPKETVETEFVLHKHYHNVNPHWDIRIKLDNRLLEFNVYKNPVEMEPGEEAEARKKYCQDLTWFIKKGRGIERKVAGKWTKIDVIDYGVAKVSEDHNFIELHGEKVDGVFEYKNGKLIKGIAEREYLPVPPSGKMLGPKMKPETCLLYTSPSPRDRG